MPCLRSSFRALLLLFALPITLSFTTPPTLRTPSKLKMSNPESSVDAQALELISQLKDGTKTMYVHMHLGYKAVFTCGALK